MYKYTSTQMKITKQFPKQVSLSSHNSNVTINKLILIKYMLMFVCHLAFEKDSARVEISGHLVFVCIYTIGPFGWYAVCNSLFYFLINNPIIKLFSK